MHVRLISRICVVVKMVFGKSSSTMCLQPKSTGNHNYWHAENSGDFGQGATCTYQYYGVAIDCADDNRLDKLWNEFASKCNHLILQPSLKPIVTACISV